MNRQCMHLAKCSDYVTELRYLTKCSNYHVLTSAYVYYVIQLRQITDTRVITQWKLVTGWEMGGGGQRGRVAERVQERQITPVVSSLFLSLSSDVIGWPGSTWQRHPITDVSISSQWGWPPLTTAICVSCRHARTVRSLSLLLALRNEVRLWWWRARLGATSLARPPGCER